MGTSDDLLQTFDEMKSFPKQPLDAGLIPVKLKRKKTYKHAVLKAWINPEICIKAVKYFREQGHPSYQDIQICENYSPELHMDNDISSDNSDAEEMNGKSNDPSKENVVN